MRRVFVIFLALLFPLNVFALSMSVSSIQTGATPSVTLVAPFEGAAGNATVQFIEILDSQVICDIDPDEPPAGMDFHDSAAGLFRLQLPLLPGQSLSLLPSERRGLDPFPPIKPPPEA